MKNISQDNPTKTMVDLSFFDKRLEFDIRYAGQNNFTGRPQYSHAQAWLQREAADSLRLVHDGARARGVGIKIFDAYRPWHVTQTFWNEYPTYRDFIANPAEGSVHNRGCAVDLTLIDINSGLELPMPSAYDEFSERAYPTYMDGDPQALANRDLLRTLMEPNGFSVHPHEWWHFDHCSWPYYPVMNMEFEELSRNSRY